MRACALLWLEIIPKDARIFPMKFQSRRRRMPARGEDAGMVHPRPEFVNVSGVLGSMLFWRKALKIVWMVVECVAILVVDLMPFWDRPVKILPDAAVQIFRTPTFDASAAKILPRTFVFGVWVDAPFSAAVLDNRFLHSEYPSSLSMISPYRKASILIQPLFSVQTLWQGVAVSLKSPASNVRTGAFFRVSR